MRRQSAQKEAVDTVCSENREDLAVRAGSKSSSRIVWVKVCVVFVLRLVVAVTLCVIACTVVFYADSCPWLGQVRLPRVAGNGQHDVEGNVEKTQLGKIESDGCLLPPCAFTAEELLQFDGSDPSKPLYLGIMGEVFDVTTGKQFYGKQEGYNIFVGRDASRSFATGCFDPNNSSCVSSSLVGLDDEQRDAVKGWHKFYRDHETYRKVGYIIPRP